jgi:hypothetical protein
MRCGISAMENHEKIARRCGTVGSPRDYRKLPDEDHVLRSTGLTRVPPISFRIFRFKEMKSVPAIEKMKGGPVGLLTGLPRASFRQKKMLFILPMPLDSISKWQSTRPWQMSPMPDKAGAEHQPKCARARTRQRCIAVKPRE